MAPGILYLVHRIPYPPNKGDKIRSFHLLRRLARDYRVFLGAFIDDPEDERHAGAVGEYCAETHFVRLDPRRARLRSLRGLVTGEALSLPYYRDDRLTRWVAQVTAREGIEKVVVFSSTMAQYVLNTGFAALRRVVDYVDVDSDKWRQYAPTRRWPMSWVYGREARKLLDFERRVIAACDAGVFVSPHEAALFRELAPAQASKVWHANNGVDLAYFSPGLGLPNPFTAAEQPLVFVGAMDYWPNVDAVRWFAEGIFPQIRARVPQAVFYIVGGSPSPQVRALERLPGVRVTGRVADVRPYVAHAAVSVAPLRIARGVQNKVLESMAMGRPTVVTPAALEGIDAEPGRELLLAEDGPNFARLVCQLIEGALDGPAIAAAARRRAVAAYDWEHTLAAFGDLLLGPSSASPAREAVRE